MRIVLILLVFILIKVQFSYGQEAEAEKSNSPILVTFAIPRTDTKLTDRRAGSMILDKVQKLIGAEYPSSFGTLYKVVPSYAVKDIRTVETMETRVYVDLDVYLRLRGQGFFKDSLLRRYSVTASDVKEDLAAQKAVNSIFADGNKIYQFAVMIDSLFNDRYNINGARTLQALQALPLNTVKELDHIMLELLYFKDYESMTGPVDEFKNKILKKRSQIICETEIPKLRISVESTIYTPSEVVQKLLSVSPDAACSDEVLALAKLIGQQAQKMPAAESEKLTVIMNIHQDNNATEWRRRQ